LIAPQKGERGLGNFIIMSLFHAAGGERGPQKKIDAA